MFEVRDPQTARDPVTGFEFFSQYWWWFPVLDFLILLVQFGPRTRTEPLGPRPTGFGPWIPGSNVIEPVLFLR